MHDVPRERYVAPAVSRSWQVSEEEEDESGCGMDAAWMRHGCGMVADEEMRWTCERDWRCMAAWREVRIRIGVVQWSCRVVTLARFLLWSGIVFLVDVSVRACIATVGRSVRWLVI